MTTVPTRYLRLAPLALLAVLTAGCASKPAEPEDPGIWPQWRGPGGLGVSPLTDLPVRWSADGPEIRWRAALRGEGNSSPIVSRGRVFVTAARGGPAAIERVLYALDEASGKILWETVVITAPKEVRHHFNTFAAPTPATDGERIFVHYGQHLAAVDFEGEVLWVREIDPLFVEFSLYGAGSSPVLAGEAVLIAHDRETTEKPDGWIAAYAREDGRELWRRSWNNTCCSYSTPLVRSRGGALEAVFSKSGEVVGYDPLSGERLWHHELVINQPVPSPVADGPMLAVFGGGNQVRYGAMLRLDGSGKVTRPEALWESDKVIPQTASPVLYNGLLFTVNDLGVIVCYDASTGDVKWRQRLSRGSYRPSLVAGDGKVYATNAEGLTTVIAATDRFQRLSENPLGEGSNASPAISEECLLLRSRSAVFCVRSDSGETAEGAEAKPKRKKGKGKGKKKRAEAAGEAP